MKIVISESQLRSITLNEVGTSTERKARNIYSDDNVLVRTIDGEELNQKFKSFVQVKNLTNQYMAIFVEKGDEWGYRGEE